MKITADLMNFRDLNEQVRAAEDSHIEIMNCIGQRYIASGLSGKTVTIHGTPGNALGAYLNNCRIDVFGNAQDATGDTMNGGTIVVHGSCGDAAGYAMRGGKILIKENTGYRAGIHMKAYKDKIPVLVVGGKAGSFLGEYQAGGLIIVLGLNLSEGESPVGNFCGTGMHGGKIFIRTKEPPRNMPEQVLVMEADENDLKEIEAYIDDFCKEFNVSKNEIYNEKFYLLVPNSKAPYKQLYAENLN
ncbi:MAG: glutamate synthase [Spirochaetales bacterium]|nr:glutamate synthase [Spirochaetales bacterium]